MQLRYLETAEPGLRWFRAYYRQNPQLDLVKAAGALRQAEARLVEFPHSAPLYEDFATVRECKLQGTAFSLLYTIARDTIYVIDLRDQRGQRSAAALTLFTQELRVRHGIVEKT